MVKPSEKKNNSSKKIGIVISKFNEPITESLLNGALKALGENGVKENEIEVFYVPGAFEIPAVLKKLCRQNINKNIYSGFITIGCVIKGETAHFDYICNSVSDSINKISYEYEMPVGFCVLMCYTALQAHERSLSPPDKNNNKGYEAAITVLEMISVLNKI